MTRRSRWRGCCSPTSSPRSPPSPAASPPHPSTTFSPGFGRDPSAPRKSACARSLRWPERPRSSPYTWARSRCGLRRRAGLIAAAMVAVSPVLIWFSQDARAYALVFLLTSLSFLFFARARGGGGRRDLTWWAIFSALAICTHYFAGFVVAPEAAWLLIAARDRRRAGRRGRRGRRSSAPLLAPLALEQAGNAPRRLDRQAAAAPAPRTRRRQAGRR